MLYTWDLLLEQAAKAIDICKAKNPETDLGLKLRVLIKKNGLKSLYIIGRDKFIICSVGHEKKNTFSDNTRVRSEWSNKEVLATKISDVLNSNRYLTRK